MKRLIITIFFLFTLLITISILDGSQKSFDYFSKTLSDTGIRTSVSIDGLQYQVDDGVVTAGSETVSKKNTLTALKLAYEKTAAERSPIFGFPSVDPVEFSRSILSLQKVQEKLAKSQTNPLDTYLIRSALFPIRFLESAALLERARQDFITSGSIDGAIRYRGLLSETFQSYESDLIRFYGAFLIAVPEHTPSYGTIARIIDRKESVRILSYLSEEIAVAKARRRSQTLCILGVTSRCDSQNLMLPYLSPAARNMLQKRGAPDDVKNLYLEAGFPLDATQSVEILKSSCVTENASTVFSFMTQKRPETGTYTSPVYTGDVILVRSASYAKSFFYHYFNEKEVEFVLTNPLTHYECPDASSDFASAFATLHVAQFAKTHDLSPYLQPDIASSVAALNKKLSSDTPVLESDAITYLNTLLLHVPRTKENESAYRELIGLSLGLSYKTTGLAEFINTMAEFEKENQTLSQKQIDFDISAKNMFYLRSGFTSLLRIPNHQSGITFRTNTLSGNSQPYVYYSELNHSLDMRRDIRSNLEFFRRIHLQI